MARFQAPKVGLQPLCYCSLAAFAVSAALLLLLRAASAAYQGCGDEVLGLLAAGSKGESPGGPELGWKLLHLLGLRNVALLLEWGVPGYHELRFSARAQREGEASDAAGGAPRRWCAVTIDDVVGMDPSGFSSLLDLLEDEAVNATFFVIANNDSVVSPEGRRLLRSAVDRGHELGNHGLWDAPMTGLSSVQFDEALSQWEARLHGAVGQHWPVRPTDFKWFRPPRGLITGAMADVLEVRGYRSVLADVYSDDWLIPDPAFHTQVLLRTACDGSIILLHVPDRPERQQTLAILRAALPELRRRGFGFRRLSDLFNEGDGERLRFAPCAVALLLSAVALLLFLVASVLRLATWLTLELIFLCAGTRPSQRVLQLGGRKDYAMVDGRRLLARESFAKEEEDADDDWDDDADAGLGPARLGRRLGGGAVAPDDEEAAGSLLPASGGVARRREGPRPH